MAKTDEYKNAKKEIQRQKRLDLWNKTKHMFSIFPENDINKENDSPDISTITEHIAFVIDGEVVEIMHCQTKLAAILLSEPEIVKIEDGKFAKPGWKYENGIFIEPVQEQPEREITTKRDEEAIQRGLQTFKEFQDEMKQTSVSTFKEFMSSIRKKVNDKKDSI